MAQTIEQQYQEAYLAKFGEPIEDIDSWQSAYRTRESLSIATKEHHLYYREEGKPELMAVFRGQSVPDVWKTLATMLNYKYKTNENLYNILINAINEYNRKVPKVGRRVGKPIEFPVKGEELEKMFTSNVLQNICMIRTVPIYSKIN